MKVYCVIPTYNEEAFIAQTLHSLVQQSVVPDKIVVVNDNSTDRTSEIIADFEKKHENISQVFNASENKHLPGSKVIRAFNKGFETLDDSFDIIVKLDADLILPDNYFERIIETFNKDPKIGMVGGFAYIEKNNEWVLESLTNKDHIRGAFKAYRKACFLEIGGLKPAMGWDTVDELLCRFYNWKIVTLEDLKVKHLKPTGATYDQSARYKQGEAFYKLGYGFWITTIASLKLALRKQKPLLFMDYLKGYFKAKINKTPLLVTKEQAKFIRNYRWKKMKEQLV